MKIIADPFPHAVFDDAFEARLVRAAAEYWPPLGWSGWHANYQQSHHRKRACAQWEHMPEPCRRLMAAMAFLDVSAFGLGSLVPDTALWGGGMQDMARGDVLGRHIDADTHRLSGMRRRLNAILFLSPRWDVRWGGELELWDREGRVVEKFITPAPGRLVVFETGDDTWHSVSYLTCPPEARRMTLACWWYGPPKSGKRDRAQFAARSATP